MGLKTGWKIFITIMISQIMTTDIMMIHFKRKAFTFAEIAGWVLSLMFSGSICGILCYRIIGNEVAYVTGTCGWSFMGQNFCYFSHPRQSLRWLAMGRYVKQGMAAVPCRQTTLNERLPVVFHTRWYEIFVKTGVGVKCNEFLRHAMDQKKTLLTNDSNPLYTD